MSLENWISSRFVHLDKWASNWSLFTAVLCFGVQLSSISFNMTKVTKPDLHSNFQNKNYKALYRREKKKKERQTRRCINTRKQTTKYKGLTSRKDNVFLKTGPLNLLQTCGGCFQGATSFEEGTTVHEWDVIKAFRVGGRAWFSLCFFVERHRTEPVISHRAQNSDQDVYTIKFE